MNSAIRPLISSLHSVSCLQHPHILDHWAVQYCFTELIGDSLTTHFLAFRSTSFKASRNGTKGGACQFGELPSWAQRSADFHFLITCVLKDSNYDTSLPKILMLAILATCASSSSTKVFKCLHESDTTLTLKNKNTMHKSTGYKKLNPKFSYGKRIKKIHFQLGEDELISSSLHKTLSKLDCAAEDCSATLVEIANELGDPPFNQLIAFSVLPSASSYSGSLGGTVLLCGTNQQLANYSFPRLSMHFLRGFAY
ncbi:hypothetical protein H5410_042147 [Solanum commersonii]|uniref:Uncharacterized protein n=1 Tax=Solanum commersonii TaxID=4109 RepID=A0A9J5XTX8_SOLCO|nr:hypothetical protein H5410_042147 [Solanum commersonii]